MSTEAWQHREGRTWRTERAALEWPTPLDLSTLRIERGLPLNPAALAILEPASLHDGARALDLESTSNSFPTGLRKRRELATRDSLDNSDRRFTAL
jgi:hypothetical protein